MRYNPEVAPNAREWLGCDELERIIAVRKYHKRSGAPAPSLQGHAVVHAIVENQLAKGHAATTRALGRLVRGGVDRHEAVHALGAVLTRHIFGTLRDKRPFEAAEYDSDLDKLTVETWRRGGGADE